MHEDAVRGIGGLKLSPRSRGSDSGIAVGNLTANRRTSSHFREMPVNVIPENSEVVDEQDSSEEEKKEEQQANQP